MMLSVPSFTKFCQHGPHLLRPDGELKRSRSRYLRVPLVNSLGDDGRGEEEAVKFVSRDCVLCHWRG